MGPDELAAVVAAADASVKEFQYLTGPDRAVLYLVAAATGYRSGELAKLTPTHFDIDGDIPAVRLKAVVSANSWV